MSNKIFLYLMCIAVSLCLIVGCSNTEGGTAVIPSTGNDIAQSTDITDLQGNRQLWGFWDVKIDPISGQCDIVPLRTINFTANVNNLLEAQPGNLLIEDIDVTDFFTEGRLDCTITLKHPFTGLDMYHGFDVWGVFMHNENGSLDYDGLTYGADPDTGDNVAVLLNPDGWTRWFNFTEFSGSSVPILEFTPGELANIPNPTATLNSYRIFADGLGLNDSYYDWIKTSGNDDNRGWFTAGAVNSRRYELEFPIIDSTPVAEFQYAVIATWEEGDPTLTGNPDTYDPGDFPTAANVEEAFFVSVSTGGSDLYYAAPGDLGGTFAADIEVFDWQGGSVGGLGVPNEVESIIVEGDFVPTGSHEFSQVDLAGMAVSGTVNSSIFQVEIANCTPQASGEAVLWVVVEAAGASGDSFDQGFPTEYPDPARRASFLLSSVTVAGEIPGTIELTSPNGGEEWIVGTQHDITWTTTGYTGQIKLEYSKDEFVADTHEIIAATDYDSSYEWTIPDDPSDTVRVRATLVGNPAVYDDSDADFSIVKYSWVFDDIIWFGGDHWSNPNSEEYMDISPALCEKQGGEIALTWAADDTYNLYSQGSFWWTRRSVDNGVTYGYEYCADSASATMHRCDRNKIIPGIQNDAWAMSDFTLYTLYFEQVEQGSNTAAHGITWPSYNDDIAMDADGYVYAIYDRWGPHLRMKHSQAPYNMTPSYWMNYPAIYPEITIASSAYCSHVRSTGIDSFDVVWLAFYNSLSSQIRLAHSTDAAPHDSWDNTTVVYNAGAGISLVKDLCLFIDSDDVFHICYTRYDSSSGNYQLVYTKDDSAFDDPTEQIVYESSTVINDGHISVGSKFGKEVIIFICENNQSIWLVTLMDGQSICDPEEIDNNTDDIDPDAILDADQCDLHSVWSTMDGDNYDIARRNGVLTEE